MKYRYLVPMLISGFAMPTLQANIIGSDLQNFNPSMSTSDYATVHSARTIGKGRLGLGLFVNNATNTLPYFDNEENTNPDTSKKFNNSVTGLDLSATYGVLDNWDLSLAVPYIIDQSTRNDDLPHGYFERLGVTELRFSTKLQVINSESFHLGFVATGNYNRLIDNPYSGNVPWPHASFEIVTGTQLGPVDWSFNIGRRWRHAKFREDLQDELPISPPGDQWLASTGVAIDLPKTDLDLIGEIYGADAEHDFSRVSPRSASVAEGLVGIRHPLPADLQFHAGVGSELNHSLSSADLRVYLGLRWVADLNPKKEAAKTKAPAPAHFQLASTGVLDRPADVIIDVDEIFFQFNSAEIRDPRGYKVMEQLSSALQARGIDRVVIEGYACSLGTEDYNLGLSDNRAERIERIMIEQYHVPPEKLVTVGWGEQRAKYSNGAEESRMLNRRVTFKIFYAKPEVSTQIAH